MLFVIHMIDRPNSAELRAAHAEAHGAYLRGHLDTIYLGGPLRSDDGQTNIGSLIIKDFPDRDAVHTFLDDEPYSRAGLFESVLVRAFHPVGEPS